MAKMILPLNATHIITVNNGTARSFIFNVDGSLALPSSGSTFKAILNPSAVTASDKVFNLPNRSGNVALEDSTSITNMLPAQSGHAGQHLQTDGAGTLTWQAVAASGLTTLNGVNANTYNAQTFAIGSTGTAPSWASVNSNTDTHTLNIPYASTASVTGGLLSNADYLRIPFKDTGNTFGGIQTFTNPPQITNPGIGTNDVATYGQVLAARNGIGLRPPVDALDSVTVSATLAGITSVDGQPIGVGFRVLATALTGGNGNKVYKCTSTGPSVWALELDGQLGTGAPADGDVIFIKSGSTYADQQWAYNGTAWILYNRASAYTFSTGLNLTGTTVTVTYGATGTTACVGNDARLSDARTPTAHVLDSGSHTISGKTAGQVLIATSATGYGFTTFSQDVSVNGSGVVTIAKVNNVPIADLALQQFSSTIATGGPTLVPNCAWAIATYRTVRIDYSVTVSVGNYFTGYITLIHDGTTPRITFIEDDGIGSGSTNLAFTTDINAGNIRLLCNNTSGSAATMKFVYTGFPV